MKNILVTGGAGFIGSHTVVELINSGYHPIILDDFRNSSRDVIQRLAELTKTKLTCYDQDYKDVKNLNQILKKESIDGVIHFAAYKAVGESSENPLKYYHNNVSGFVSLLRALETAKIKNIVFSSSCTVYGEPDKLPLDESAPVKAAASPYGETKKMCEKILHDATLVSKSFKSLSLRYFNPIGAHPSALIGELPIGTPTCLVPFLTQSVAGLRGGLTVYGDDYPTPDGTCIRDYVHVVDLAKAHIKAFEFLEGQEATTYDICNVGTGQGSSVLEVINEFERVTGKKVDYKIGPRRSGDLITSYASVDKAKTMLGWQSGLTLADALKDAWRWQETLR